MHSTSERHKALFQAYLDGSREVKFETRISVEGKGYLVNEEGFNITFGGVRIIVYEGSNPNDGFAEDLLRSVRTSAKLFSGNTSTVGSCVAAQLDVVMTKPKQDIPRNAKLTLFTRLTDGVETSTWIQKGEYFVDTRQEKDTGTGAVRLTIRAYDAMLKAEQDYPWDRLTWPSTDITVVRDICSHLGIELDGRTSSIMKKGYAVQLPDQYSCREILGYIAAMYGGNFVISDLGKLLLVQMGKLPAQGSEDSQDIGQKMRSFTSVAALPGYDRVELLVDDDNAYYAGSSTGRTLTLECPWGTQSMANALLTQFQEFQYQPYKAESAILDPAAELGDGITANGVYSGIYTMDLNYGPGFRGTLTAPWEEELDHEFPYVPRQDRKIRRQLHGMTTELTVQAGLIQGEITDRINEIDILESQITQQAGEISAKVSKSGGSSETFGWTLTDSYWNVWSNNEPVMWVTKDGLQVKGRVVAESGSIGGFTLEDGYLSTNGQTWGGDEYSGIYIGPSGIQLGEYFSVSRYGELYAYSGTFTGQVYAGSISYDGDAGYFDGNGLAEFTVGGWWGNDRIDTYTLTPENFQEGVNESLANADWAASVLSGAESIGWLGALEIVTNELNVTDTLYFGGYQLYLGSFPDKNGNIQRCVQWYD